MSYKTFNLQCIHTAFYQDSINQEPIFSFIPEYYKNRKLIGPKQYDFVCLLFPDRIIEQVSVFQNKSRLSLLFRGLVYKTYIDSDTIPMYEDGFKNFPKSLIDILQDENIFSEMLELCSSFLKAGHYDQSKFARYFSSVLQKEKNNIIENDHILIQTLINSNPAKALAWFVLFAVLEKSINTLHDLFFGTVDCYYLIPGSTICPGANYPDISSSNHPNIATEFEPHYILPSCVSNFCGRQKYLSFIHKSLHSSDSMHHIFLYGISGIGKTELAKQYAHKFRKFYNVILFITDSGTILNTVCNEISLNGFPSYSFHDGKNEDTQTYFNKKLQYLQKISDEQILFIIDNFNEMDDDNLEDFLSGEYSVIFTTQTDFSEKGYLTLPVLPFELFNQSHSNIRLTFGQNHSSIPLNEFMESGMTMTHFQRCYGKNILPEQQVSVKKIFEHFEGHLFILELIAKQMRADRLSPEKMLEYLNENGISMPESFSLINHRSSSSPGTIYSYVKHIISPEKLNQDEQYILKNLALMPLSGVSAESFCCWCNTKSFNTLNNLIYRSYIKHDPDNDRISLHPLIRELIFCNMNPTADDVADMVLNLSKIVSDCWNQPQNTLSVFNEVIISILTTMTSFSVNTVRAYESLTSYCWQINQFELAIRVSQNAYQFAYEQHTDNQTLGLLAKAVGNSLYSSGEKGKIQSKFWFEKMWDYYTYEKDAHKNLPEIILAAQRIARFHIEAGAIDTAEHWLKKAQEAIKVMDTKEIDRSLPALYSLGDFHYMYACLEILRESPEQALDHAEQAIHFYQKDNGDIISLSITAAMTIKAKACTLKKKFHTAKNCLDKAFRLENQYRNKLHNSHLIRVYIARGDLECWKGNIGLAIQNYEAAKQIIHDIYDTGNDRFLGEIKEKLHLCKNSDSHTPLYIKIHTGL